MLQNFLCWNSSESLLKILDPYNTETFLNYSKRYFQNLILEPNFISKASWNGCTSFVILSSLIKYANSSEFWVLCWD